MPPRLKNSRGPRMRGDALHQQRKIVLRSTKVETVRVHDQQRRRRVLVEKARIAFGEPDQIRVRHVLFVGDAAPLHALDQGIGAACR